MYLDYSDLYLQVYPQLGNGIPDENSDHSPLLYAYLNANNIGIYHGSYIHILLYPNYNLQYIYNTPIVLVVYLIVYD